MQAHTQENDSTAPENKVNIYSLNSTLLLNHITSNNEIKKNTQSGPQTVNVYSLDTDNCTINDTLKLAVLNDQENTPQNHSDDEKTKKFKRVEKHLEHSNEPLLKDIGNKSKGASKNIVILGSAHQNELDEIYPLCSTFLLTEKLCDILKTRNQEGNWHYDRYLTTQSATKDYTLDSNYKLLPWMCESNIWLFYAQIHHIASLNPDKNINFYAYNDRTGKLWDSYKFFNTHPNLMPKKVKLHFYEYNGTILKSFVEKAKGLDIDYQDVQGTGETDNDYDKTIRNDLIIERFDCWRIKDKNEKKAFEEKFISTKKDAKVIQSTVPISPTVTFPMQSIHQESEPTSNTNGNNEPNSHLDQETTTTKTKRNENSNQESSATLITSNPHKKPTKSLKLNVSTKAEVFRPSSSYLGGAIGALIFMCATPAAVFFFFFPLTSVLAITLAVGGCFIATAFGAWCGSKIQQCYSKPKLPDASKNTDPVTPKTNSTKQMINAGMASKQAPENTNKTQATKTSVTEKPTPLLTSNQPSSATPQTSPQARHLK